MIQFLVLLCCIILCKAAEPQTDTHNFLTLSAPNGRVWATMTELQHASYLFGFSTVFQVFGTS